MDSDYVRWSGALPLTLRYESDSTRWKWYMDRGMASRSAPWLHREASWPATSLPAKPCRCLSLVVNLIVFMSVCHPASFW